MIETVFPNFYKIEIPLPQSPLKATNSYLIRGRRRCLIVDTGMNRRACMTAMRSALDELRVDPDATDYFITHLHADHLGLVGDLAAKTSRIFFGKAEAALVQAIAGDAGGRVDRLFRFYLSNGFPEEELRKSVENHPGFRYGSKRRLDFSPIEEGGRIEAGDYRFDCVETPGHSPGHMCLYEPEKKILLSGDHILNDITPNITRWPELDNPLKAYFESLRKVYSFEVDLVLPGHRSAFADHRKRIGELQAHHRKRLAETSAALKMGEKTAWETAPHLTWDIEAKSWEAFPSVQKWFAIGEVIAHLNYLVGEGSVRKRREGGIILYSLA